jgi:type II secretory pathway predicted ATPase ExeA
MALSVHMKEQLAALKLPGDGIVRERLARWMAQTGWNDQDVADRIARIDGRAYARATVNQFRNGRYCSHHPAEGNDRALVAALVSLMDANPTINERILDGKTYPTESYKKLRRAFRNALDRGWSYCVDGASGTQKTRVLLALAAEIEAEDASKNGSGRRVLYVRCRPKMSRMDLLTEILVSGGMPGRRMYIGQSLRRLRHNFASRRVLLVLDEAQDLDDAALNTVRELLDEPPYFGLIFAGTHDLKARFNLLENERLRSRQRKFIELEGLTGDEVKEIWESEIGRLSAERFTKLSEFCTVVDYRRQGRTYLSARQLFFAIDGQKHQSGGDA